MYNEDGLIGDNLHMKSVKNMIRYLEFT